MSGASDERRGESFQRVIEILRVCLRDEDVLRLEGRLCLSTRFEY